RQLGETDQVTGIKDTSPCSYRCSSRAGSSRGGAATREWRDAGEVCRQRVLFVCSDKIIHSELLVAVQRQLADDGGKSDLWCFHVHLVENLCYLHHHLATSQDDDGIGTLISDDLGIANDHGLWRSIDRLS